MNKLNLKHYSIFASLLTLMLVFFLLPTQVSATVISSTQSGNWSDTATWVGGVVPGTNDDVTIVSHDVIVDTSTTASSTIFSGTSGDWGTLTVNTNFTINNNITWGDFSTLTQAAGVTFTAGNFYVGSAFLDETEWIINGTSGNRATVAGAGTINHDSSNARIHQKINWNYADFTVTGDILIQASENDAAKSSVAIDRCYFNGTGYINVGNANANANISISVTNNDFRDITTKPGNPNANAVLLVMRTATPTATTTVSGNTFSQAVDNRGILRTNKAGLLIDNNIFHNMGFSPNGVNSYQEISNNVFYNELGLASGSNAIQGDGGLYAHDNIFAGDVDNPHTYQGTTNSGREKDIVKENIFDHPDNNGDFVMLKASDIDVIQNIFLGGGAPTNSGTTDGVSTPTFLIKRNTSYMNISASWPSLLWSGETQDHAGTVTVESNLAGDNYSADVSAFLESGGAVTDSIDWTDYNWFYNNNGGVLDHYNGFTMTSRTEGVDEGFGLYDQTGDPQFTDSTRNVAKWDTSLSGAGTQINALNEMLKRNENISGDTFNTSYTPSNLLSYIRIGFTPQNYLLNGTGKDGEDIGAVEVTATAPITATPPTYSVVTLSPLSISNQSISNITDTAAEILWSTDRDSHSEVLYGENHDSYKFIEIDWYNVRNHIVKLTNLFSDTTYYYQIQSKPPLGFVTIDPENYSFTTLSTGTSTVTSPILDLKKQEIEVVEVEPETEPAIDDEKESNLSQGQIDAIINLLISFDVEQVVIDNILISLGSAMQTQAITGPFAIGITSDQVTLLQQTLSQDSTIYPEAITSGYYGILTTYAVQRFQCKYIDLCEGTPLENGYGLAGPKTKGKLNEVYGLF